MTRQPVGVWILVIVVSIGGASPSAGQGVPSTRSSPTAPLPSSVAVGGDALSRGAPEVVTQDADEPIAVRAIKVTEPMRLDGRLDEKVYEAASPITGFIQTQPNAGAHATEKTEVWIMFDREALYVSARLWDSAPEHEWLAKMTSRST